ncbi:MAG TPA: hypothetical protein ENG03_07655 [Thioploca sp.]|nr:hypothetical protein [Thioploca sp.]
MNFLPTEQSPYRSHREGGQQKDVAHPTKCLKICASVLRINSPFTVDHSQLDISGPKLWIRPFKVWQISKLRVPIRYSQ